MDAGQGADSPCIDAGVVTAAAVGLDERTTRTDGVVDTGLLDLGFHYDNAAAVPAPTPPGACFSWDTMPKRPVFSWLSTTRRMSGGF